MKLKLTLTVLTVAAAALLVSRTTPVIRVGPLPGGGFLLNDGWVIRPAGARVNVETFPMRELLSPDGKFLVVLNGGYNPPTISVIDVAAKREVRRVRVPDAWLGLAFARGGKTLYVGGGSRACVFAFDFDSATGGLGGMRTLSAVTDPAAPGHSFIGDVAVSPDGHMLYAADLLENKIAVFNLQSERLSERWDCGRRPYRILFPPDGKTFYVSSWADAAVYRYDALSGAPEGVTRAGSHPADLLWLNKPAPADEENESPYGARLFVATANTNSVASFGVTGDGTLRPLESINISMTPLQPLGMTPSALAVNADGTRLYVVCSDGNAVAVVDISTARSRILGFIPTGWYPTGALAMPGGSLLVLNGKGDGSRPNPRGPNPMKRVEKADRGSDEVQYVGRIQRGTVQFVPPFTDDQLDAYTKTVYDNSPYDSDQLRNTFIGANVNEFAARPDHPSPIQHVIYIIKENRTYDQVLGDIGKGNSDPSLTLFGEKITPNLHKLAREFVLYDNFYVNADVSAEGHNWASAAIAPDYTVKMWPNSYAGRRKTYDYEGGEPANLPPAGYLWSNAIAAGVSLRNYGEWCKNLPPADVHDGRQIAKVLDPALRPYTDMNFRTFDLNYPDVGRAAEFLREWREFDEKDDAPKLILMRIPNDHTSGLAAGKISPLSAAADNDYAIGQIVQGVSQSKLWASTAIFIIEDDAQNGPDHVDSHRSPVFVLSPYTHRGIIDSTMYNQTGVLRTVEAILGLHPMTQFDAASTTMFGGFATTPDTQPYVLEQPRISLTERNPEHGAGAVASAKMDFSAADRIDDDALNAILWRAIRGTDSPPPVHSMFSH